jgi:hypothetical protein
VASNPNFKLDAKRCVSYYTGNKESKTNLKLALRRSHPPSTRWPTVPPGTHYSENTPRLTF